MNNFKDFHNFIIGLISTFLSINLWSFNFYNPIFIELAKPLISIIGGVISTIAINYINKKLYLKKKINDENTMIKGKSKYKTYKNRENIE